MAADEAVLASDIVEFSLRYEYQLFLVRGHKRLLGEVSTEEKISII